MDEMNNLQENQNNEEIKEQGTSTPETTKVNNPTVKIPILKTPIPKLPLIIGGAIAGIAAIAISVALIIGGGNGNQGDENNPNGNGHEHSFGEWTVVDDPTCTEAGIEERICECDEKENRPINALGHTEVVDASVVATCKSTGLTEGKHCSTCNTVIIAQSSVEKLPHTYDDVYDTNCNICGETRVVDCSHTDTEVIPGRDASCTDVGLTDGTKCKKCGETLVAQETIPVTAHTYDNKYDDECNVCGYKRDAECAHTETESINGYDATCTETGLTDGTKCKKCGETITAQETIPMLAHTYDDKYDEDCNVCGHIREAECAHIETETVEGKEATCTATGLTDGSKCKKCGENLVPQSVIPLKPHTEAIYTALAATCTSTGYTEGKYCSVCSKVLTAQSTVPMKPHTEVIDSALAATCTSTGLTEGKHCSVCSKVLVYQTEVPMKPHTEVIDAAVSATCASTGLTEGKHCSVCNTVIIAQNIIPAAHKYSDKYEYNDDYHWFKCTVCNKKNISNHITDDEAVCSLCNHIVCPSSGIIYDFSDDGTYAMVVAYNGSAKKIRIADTYEGLPVRTIYNNAFYENKTITTIIIPDSVTSIGDYAFYKCSSLASVVIPDSVTSIGDYAFNSCYTIRSVEIGDGVASIGRSAFEKCEKLYSVEIGNSVVSIGVNAFYYCSSLTSVVIPDSVTSIGSAAFYLCHNLDSVLIGDSVTSIGSNAFGDCYDLKGVYISDVANWCSINFENYYANPLYRAKNLYVDNVLITELEIPDSVTSIGDYVFYNCSNLASVVIGDSVSSISSSAFNGCSNLQFNEYENCTYLGSKDNPYFALIKATTQNLSSYTIHENTKVIANSAFSGCSRLSSVVIPDSVTSIGDAAFYSCSNLTSVEICNSVTSIGERAFYSCSNLTSVVIPNSVTSIGKESFYKCSSLASVVIGDNVTSIGDNAFYDCQRLRSMVIGNSVTRIGHSAFLNCSNLKDVYYTGNEAGWKNVVIEPWNSYIQTATIHYNYVPEN